MGIRLHNEVRDGAPADWTVAERLIALLIAEDANDQTRAGWIPISGRWRGDDWHDGLSERSGLKPDSVRKVLQQLGQKGYEFRVPIGAGKDGRLVYAAKGHSLDFRVPEFLPRPRPERPAAVADDDDRADHHPPYADRADHDPAYGADRADHHPPYAGVRADHGPPYGPQRADHDPDRADRDPVKGGPRSAPSSQHLSSLTPSPSRKREECDDPRFAEFWSAYPRKVGKRAAWKQWEAATAKRGTDPAAIIKAALRYADKRAGEDPRYTAHPATWLSQGRYDDEDQPEPPADREYEWWK